MCMCIGNIIGQFVNCPYKNNIQNAESGDSTYPDVRTIDLINILWRFAQHPPTWITPIPRGGIPLSGTGATTREDRDCFVASLLPAYAGHAQRQRRGKIASSLHASPSAGSRRSPVPQAGSKRDKNARAKMSVWEILLFFFLVPAVTNFFFNFF